MIRRPISRATRERLEAEAARITATGFNTCAVFGHTAEYGLACGPEHYRNAVRYLDSQRAEMTTGVKVRVAEILGGYYQ